MMSEVEERPRLVTAGYGRHGCQWVKSPAELLNNRKFQTLQATAQRVLRTGIDRDQVKESLHQQQKQQGQYYVWSALLTSPLLHDGQHICLYDSHTKTWQPGTVQGQTCAPRSYTVQSSTTGTMYCHTRCQLKPDTVLSDHRNTQGLSVNHPMPCDQKRGKPGQPVELTSDVAIKRCSPPSIKTPKAHHHGYSRP